MEDNMKIKHFASLLAGVLLVGMVSCEYQTIVPYDVVIPDTPVDFATEIEPIFTTVGCISCHDGSMVFSLAAGKAYSNLISRNLVDITTPANSKILTKIAAGHNNKSFSATQSALILKWVTEGAKGVIPPVSFKTEIEPIWTSADCTSCHSGSLSPDLRATKSYASLTSKGLVKANDPAGSPLMQKINGGHNATKITADQKALITKWINEGALNN
jgi:hypothetical protein